MTQPSKPSKKSSSKKDPRKAVHKASADHHSHHVPDRRTHPRGDDIFTKIQDATEKVLRERKHELKKKSGS